MAKQKFTQRATFQVRKPEDLLPIIDFFKGKKSYRLDSIKELSLDVVYGPVSGANKDDIRNQIAVLKTHTTAFSVCLHERLPSF